MQDNLDPTQQARIGEERKQLSDESLKQQEEDILWLMSEPQGRRIVYGLLEEAGVFRGSYNGNPNDTLYNEGQRAVGLRYLAKVMSHQDFFVTMLSEHQENVDRANRRPSR